MALVSSRLSSVANTGTICFFDFSSMTNVFPAGTVSSTCWSVGITSPIHFESFQLSILKLAKLREGRVLHDTLDARSTLRIAVVNANNFAVTRQVEIAFDPITPLFPGEPERG